MARIRKINGCLHIEVAGCIVNIVEHLRDTNGREVTSVEIIPDDRFSGEPKWKLYGQCNNRVVKLKTVRCR